MNFHTFSSTSPIINPRTGEKRTLKEWADHLGIHQTTLRRRLESGRHSFEKALNTEKFRKRTVRFTDPATGDNKTVTEWFEQTGIPCSTLLQRIKNKSIPRDQVLFKGDLRQYSRSVAAKERAIELKMQELMLDMVREKANAGVAGFDKLLAAVEKAARNG